MTFHSPKQTLRKIALDNIKGISTNRLKALSSMGIYNVMELIEFKPRRYLDRSMVSPINKLVPDEEATVLGEIVSKKMISRGKRRLIVTIHDGYGLLDAVWFNQVHYFDKIFRERQTAAFSGKVSFFKSWQIIHPDFDIIDESRKMLHTGHIIPLYPGSETLRKAGLNSYGMRRIISNVLQKYRGNIEENLPPYLIKRYKLTKRSDAFQQLHFPESEQLLEQTFRRFKYEELFFLELLMALRKHFYKIPEISIQMNIDNKRIKKLVDSLPYKLTDAQRKVLREMYNDLRSQYPMNRLLQGDVGSGKTVVALLNLLMAVSSGFQGALMAPTEILAQQHYFNIINILNWDEVRVALLLGSLKESEKKLLHQKIGNGELDLVIGTHALIQENVTFKKLGLVIIDEQHRFGVMQRAELVKKGLHPHVLVMTATPIPRSLALTLYGDLDLSIIDELPPGRQKIKTHWRTEEKLNLIYDFVRQKVKDRQQAYIVYPLIEESEKLDLKAAKVAYRKLSNEIFPEYKLALLHGRLKIEEKEKVMRLFKNGDIDILISTTVIEVGVDVPNASIMLIEHAERFGLSQLHQLRGRVGRGAKESFCILITPENINETAQQRMMIMQNTNNGFTIADEDLRIRGSGEFFGTRQHGMPDLNYADLILDQKIVKVARNDAFGIVKKDPHLRFSNHSNCREYFEEKFVEKFQFANIS
jgi:ATP-dependent DNA helicase RecG